MVSISLYICGLKGLYVQEPVLDEVDEVAEAMEGFRALLASHDDEAEGVMAMLADPSLNEGEETIEDLAALLAQFESAVVAGEPSPVVGPVRRLRDRASLHAPVPYQAGGFTKVCTNLSYLTVPDFLPC